MTDSDSRPQTDVLIIGGAAAGLAAALQLGRARRSVTVVDAGEPRNAPATHMHSYLGHEGRPPAEFLDIARGEVARFDVDVIEGRVQDVADVSGGGTPRFAATLAGGTTIEARRVLLTTGLVDVLPDIDGLAAQWGRGVIHCPYCHGWEVRDQPIVVIGTGAMGIHQAGLFRQWSDDVTLVAHEGDGPNAEERVRFAARGTSVVEQRVAEVVSDGDDLVGVRLADGTLLRAGAVVAAPMVEVRLDAVASLDIATAEHPGGVGRSVVVDQMGATNVAGVYAAGNVVDLMGQVLQAASAGSFAGAAINAGLVTEDTDAAVRALDQAVEWDERYADQLWSGNENGVLRTEATPWEPGRALDVGCGEGADAIWLAANGWEVTGIDVTAIAIERAVQASAEAGVAVEWKAADLVADPPQANAFDLVSVHYPALRKSDDQAAITAMAAAVAPGGRLLVVGHGPIDGPGVRAHALAHGFDFDDYVQPGDVVDALGDEWEIRTDEVRPRVDPPHEGSPFTHDHVVVAVRMARPK